MQWWFVLLGAVCLTLSVVATVVWEDTLQLPWWGILLAAVFAGSLTLPIGVICATTNQVRRLTQQGPWVLICREDEEEVSAPAGQSRPCTRRKAQ